ncbi:MAG: hypothetical protein IPP48_00760 [Chitinophagaceae bacterium]|nr:hypothetical protein [Chitinophagaceae bacterium]
MAVNTQKESMVESILTITTLLLTAIWLVFIIIYAYKNDFSTDILSFFLPALGAILLSFFVGIKFIWIDSSKNPAPFRCTSVILSDENDLAIYGESLSEKKYSKKTINRPGLNYIVNYENHIKIKYSPELDEANIELKAKQLFDCLEYKIIEWLKEINAVQGSWYNREYIFLTPGGGYSEKADCLITKEMISVCNVDQESFPNNELFKIKPIECLLPSKSKIISVTTKNTFVRKFRIITNFSEILFSIEQITFGKLSPEAIISNEVIRKKKGNELNLNLTQYSYQIEINPTYYKFNRFAK